VAEVRYLNLVWRFPGPETSVLWRCCFDLIIHLPSSLFLLLKGRLFFAGKSLAGDEISEQRTKFRRANPEIFASDEMYIPNSGEVPCLWKQASVERWNQKRIFWSVAALSMQKTRIAFFKLVEIFSSPLFSFWQEVFS
jgi:hypothetical protein